MTTPHHTAPRTMRNIPDDAPATAFAPTPIGAYRRGFEDRYYDNAWFCPYRAGSAEAVEYAAGHVAAAKLTQTKGQ
jgi:hypothetical protein